VNKNPVLIPQLPTTDWPTLSEILECLPAPRGVHNWKKKNSKWYEKQRKSREVSKEVRRLALLMVRGKAFNIIPENPETIGYLMNFTKWFTKVNPKVIAVDQPIWDSGYRFRTNLDLIHERKGKTWLTTITTAKRIGTYHHARLSGLKTAIVHMMVRGAETDFPLSFPDKMSILRLEEKQNSYYEHESDGDFDAFERAYNAIR